MKLSGLLRSRPELPGLAGTARVDRHTEALLRRLKPGEIAVLDQADLDRTTADALVAIGVAAVVNASPSISGRYPNLGPDVLTAAGITLLDDVGADALQKIRDGSRIRLHEGAVYAGEIRLAHGRLQTAESVAEAMEGAKSGLTHQVEAFAANTMEFMRRERSLLLDGDGVPDVDVQLSGRQVLVVAAGHGHLDELKRLRHYIREYRPVLVGVGAGADALIATGYRPDLVVGDPTDISNTALTCGADIVLPAFADGHAPGLHRVQDLGASAVTFPSTANPEDLALLLAAYRGAVVIGTVGMPAGMVEFLDRGRAGGNASTFLTRLQLGGLVVDSQVLVTLHRSRIPVSAILLLVGAVALAGLAVLLVSGAGDALVVWLTQTMTGLFSQVAGRFR